MDATLDILLEYLRKILSVALIGIGMIGLFTGSSMHPISLQEVLAIVLILIGQKELLC